MLSASPQSCLLLRAARSAVLPPLVHASVFGRQRVPFSARIVQRLHPLNVLRRRRLSRRRADFTGSPNVTTQITGVLRRVLVAFRAMGDLRLRSPLVLFRRHWFKVVGVHTVPVSTAGPNVVDLQTRRNRADQTLVGVPVNEFQLGVGELELPVSPLSNLPGPQPARLRLVNLSPEPLVCSRPVRLHGAAVLAQQVIMRGAQHVLEIAHVLPAPWLTTRRHLRPALLLVVLVTQPYSGCCPLVTRRGGTRLSHSPSVVGRGVS